MHASGVHDFGRGEFGEVGVEIGGVEVAHGVAVDRGVVADADAVHPEAVGFRQNVHEAVAPVGVGGVGVVVDEHGAKVIRACKHGLKRV